MVYYDAEIEYLYSDGNQSISLQWNGDSSTDAFLISYKMPSPVAQMRFFHGTGGPSMYVNANKMLAYSFNNSNWRATNAAVGTNVRKTYFVDFYNKRYSVNSGNNVNTYDDTTAISNDMFLIGKPGTNPQFVGYVYSAQIYRRGELSVDLVPVRIGSIGFMYDRVRDILLPNAGTGNFILGPDKVYQEKKLSINHLSLGDYRRRLMMACNNIQWDTLPEGAIPCDMIFTTGYSTFIDSSLIPGKTMSWDAQVYWVATSKEASTSFGYIIGSKRYAPIRRVSGGAIELQYDSYYYQDGETYINSLFEKYRYKAVVTQTGSTVDTYSWDGNTLLNSGTFTYTETDYTPPYAVGFLGRKSSTTAIESGSFKGGLGRVTGYWDNHFGAVAIDLQPCYYNGYFGFWDSVSERFLTGTNPSDVYGVGETWNTSGFIPNTRLTTSGAYGDWRGAMTSPMFEIPEGCTSIRFRSSTATNSDLWICYFNENQGYVAYYTYNALDRVITVPATAKYIKATISIAARDSCYLYDVTNDQYIWKGINVQ